MVLKIFLSLLILFAVSALISAYCVYIKRYKFFGNFWGAVIIGCLGAILFNYLLNGVSKFFAEKFNVNILAAILGVILFLYILKKVTP